MRTASVYAGGVSEAEKQAARRDFDTVRPFAYTRLNARRPFPTSDETDWP
jgi:hypothetical protein